MRKRINRKFSLVAAIVLLLAFSWDVARAQTYPSYRGKSVIGTTIDVALPDLKLYGVRAKVDTGAFTSSLHCSFIHIDSVRQKVVFTPLDHSKKYELPLVKISEVKSSNGIIQKRPFVMLKLHIAGKLFETMVSLTDRKGMKLPMLLGRRALRGRFVVDVDAPMQ